jgi:hypothetical protein
MLRFPVVTGRLAPYRFYLEPKAGGIGGKLASLIDFPKQPLQQ